MSEKKKGNTANEKVTLELTREQATELLDVIIHGDRKQCLGDVINVLEPVVKKHDKERYKRLVDTLMIRNATRL